MSFWARKRLHIWFNSLVTLKFNVKRQNIDLSPCRNCCKNISPWISRQNKGIACWHCLCVTSSCSWMKCLDWVRHFTCAVGMIASPCIRIIGHPLATPARPTQTHTDKIPYAGGIISMSVCLCVGLWLINVYLMPTAQVEIYYPTIYRNNSNSDGIDLMVFKKGEE